MVFRQFVPPLGWLLKLGPQNLFNGCTQEDIIYAHIEMTLMASDFCLIQTVLMIIQRRVENGGVVGCEVLFDLCWRGCLLGP